MTAYGDSIHAAAAQAVPGRITNPILPGFHPDSSALQVGGDYYIATSTFEWWPGVDIFHSTDLVNWQWVAAPLNRATQVNLRGNYNSGSIWAPHLSFKNGLFYLVYTDVKSWYPFKDTLNYVITAPSIEGPWSDPVLVTASGFDPALFHDDDGRSYFLNMLFDWRLERPGFAGTVIQEFDTDSMSLVGERKHFYQGTSLGVCEGPQILKKDGYYYLLCAAGGTGWMHAATVARSRSLEGPWEDSPYFPLMTTRDNPTAPLQKSGHCCFLRSGDEWYVTQICARPLTERGYCTLGRETAIQRIEWSEDGWPHLANGTICPDLTVPAPAASQNVVQLTDRSERIDFAADKPLPPSLKTLRAPLIAEAAGSAAQTDATVASDASVAPRLGDVAASSPQSQTISANYPCETPDYSLVARPGWLRLYGKQSLASLDKQTLFARRWEAFDFDAETLLDFTPANFQQLAGLILFYDTDNWIYAYVTFDDEQSDQRILRVVRHDRTGTVYGSDPVALDSSTPVRLKVEVRHDKARFFWTAATAADASDVADTVPDWQPLGGDQPADHISDDYVEETHKGYCAFTGAMVGICSQDMDAHTSHADFRYFDYREIH